MDIDMPGKNGIEIIRELFQDNHNDKILVCFLSSYS
jgi:CheY-like chemotaxis protein